MTYEKACEISDYLLKTNQGFCFLQSTGEIVTKEQCENIINDFNTIK